MAARSRPVAHAIHIVVSLLPMKVSLVEFRIEVFLEKLHAHLPLSSFLHIAANPLDAPSENKAMVDNRPA